MRVRGEGDELLDRPDQDPAALARSLRDVEAVNRWLGGYRCLRRHLRSLRTEETLRVLDVGAGDAATLLHLLDWAPDGWRFVGLELNPRTAELARRRASTSPRIRIVRGDGLRLPFDDDSFDVVVCMLTLHHFRGREAVSVVREMARVARRRVLINDLERSWIHYLGSRLLSATLWRWSPITRHDGPLSVRRSFTPNELESIGESAGLTRLRVRRRFLFRVVLDGVPAPEGAGISADRAAISGATESSGASASSSPGGKR